MLDLEQMFGFLLRSVTSFVSGVFLVSSIVFSKKRLLIACFISGSLESN